MSPMLSKQKSRDKFNSSMHANDDTKRDKLKLCLRMLTLQGTIFSSGIYIYSES